MNLWVPGASRHGFSDHLQPSLTHLAGPAGHFIYPLDREGLLAAYTRLEPGVAPEDIATELGPWEDTSVHVKGVLDLPNNRDHVAFGAAERNGFVSPWAQGPIPGSDLADNAQLSGTATWAGRMLGLTPQAEVVAGAADLSVHLTSLTGNMSFTGLESWVPNAAPGAIGTGTVWGDGDLAYTVDVHGNTFVQTGGDDGIFTGAFFGARHEGMGGTLVRGRYERCLRRQPMTLSRSLGAAVLPAVPPQRQGAALPGTRQRTR